MYFYRLFINSWNDLKYLKASLFDKSNCEDIFKRSDEHLQNPIYVEKTS